MKTYVLCSIMLFWCLVTPGHANEEQQTVVFPSANVPQEDLIFIESNEKYGIDCLLYGDHFFAYDAKGQAEEIWIIRDLFFYERASGRSIGYDPPEAKKVLAMYHGFYKEVWSPNEEYLVLPLGKLLGFQIIPASDVFERLAQANNSFVRVFEASFDNAPEVFLWHSFKKWIGDDAFLFTAGTHEFNPPFIYKIGPQQLITLGVRGFDAENEHGRLSIARKTEPRVVTERDIKRMRVGMTKDAIIHYGEPASPRNYPILVYPSDEKGEYYLFYFLPTNEVERPVSGQRDEVVLVAITKMKLEEKGERLSRKEVYVFPEPVKGTVCTGMKKEIR